MQWSSLMLRSIWVSSCGHQQLWYSIASTYKSLYGRQGGISPDLLFSQCLWAPGWGAQKRMWVIIGESRSPALGTEDSGNPKVFKPFRAVWGKGLDGFAWSQSFKLGKTGWNQRGWFGFKVRKNRHFLSLSVSVSPYFLTTSQSRASFKV